MCINYKRLNLVRSTLGTFMIHKDILPKKKKNCKKFQGYWSTRKRMDDYWNPDFKMVR